jgi:hypothetical protein
MEWVFAIAIVVAAAAALWAVARVRKSRLQKRVRLEITNEGNVQSRYDLRAEDSQGALYFEFILDGDSLPVYGSVAAGKSAEAGESGRSAPPSPAAKAGGIQQRAGRAIQMSNAVAGFLSAAGAMLPRSVGTPLQQKASEIRRVEARASYVQQAPNRMAWLKSPASKIAPSPVPGRPSPVEQQPGPIAQGDGLVWAQTPSVQPGEILALDLLIRSILPARGQQYEYRAVSRSAEQASAPPVIKEGVVEIRGGFWARRYLPSLIVLAMATALLLLVFWLASTSLLA